jgi:hypothetical protein
MYTSGIYQIRALVAFTAIHVGGFGGAIGPLYPGPYTVPLIVIPHVHGGRGTEKVWINPGDMTFVVVHTVGGVPGQNPPMETLTGMVLLFVTS